MTEIHSLNGEAGFLRILLAWGRDHLEREGFLRSLGRFSACLWEFLRDSTPERRRSRWGDADYDFEQRVNTTSATVAWRDRLIGALHSPYQPTEPGIFREILGCLEVDFADFTFVDLGSGKGRVLLMASDRPFRRILGVELLPNLHRQAQTNLGKYRGASQRCFLVESILADARDFTFPGSQLVVYLFNPFPKPVLETVLENLERSLTEDPRRAYLVYNHPILEGVLTGRGHWSKTGGTHQYSIYVWSESG